MIDYLPKFNHRIDPQFKACSDAAGERRPRALRWIYGNFHARHGSQADRNPVEFVLHALAGCLTTSLVYHAAAQGIKIDSVESTFEGDLDLRGFLGMDDDVRNGYENIRVTFKIKADAPDEKLEELCELAQKRSPVFDIVTNAVPVTVRLA